MQRTASRFRYLYLAYLSGPRCERQLYRLIRRQRIRQIVEIGIGQACRAVRMIEVAHLVPPGGPMRYIGIDAFELRSDGSSLTLKAAYRTLKATGARVQVVPGDPLTALARVANSLTNTGLVLISADQDQESLAKAWFYVPRMLASKGVVLVEEKDQQGEKRLRRVSDEEIHKLANLYTARRKAA
jgi:hypothetical protein